MFDPRSPRRIVCAVALAGFVLPLAAQERSDAIVVRGPRPDNPSLAQPNIETARHRIEQIPGGANVIDADDYREARVSTLADALGLTFQQVQKYERGANRIGAGRLWELSQALDVPISYFFEDVEGDAAGVRLAPTEPAEDAAFYGEDPMSRRETLLLVRAYYGISDPAVRRRLLDLMKSLGDPVRAGPA